MDEGRVKLTGAKRQLQTSCAVIEQACELVSGLDAPEAMSLAVLAYYRAHGDDEMADELEANLRRLKVITDLGREILSNGG